MEPEKSPTIRFRALNEKPPNRIGAFVAGVICLALAGTGVWAAWHGPTSGLPFVSDGVNQVLGRIAFGGGAVIVLLIGLLAFYDAFRPTPKADD